MTTSHSNLQIGQLADLTGLTVRTLHHYEKIGLLVPSDRTNSNYRLYNAADIQRLQQIVSLKQLGFSLEQIKDCLEKPDFSPIKIMQMQLTQLTKQMQSMTEMTERLDGMIRFFQYKQNDNPTSAELLSFISLMNSMDHTFTPDEMNTIKAQGDKLGKDGIKSVENEWPQLMANVKAEMDKGTDPADPVMQAYAKRWKELVSMFSGGNPAIEAKLKKRYEENPDYATQFGPDPKLMEYIGKAMQK